jgi:negative regulator of flagellin synthesis FlgM
MKISSVSLPAIPAAASAAAPAAPAVADTRLESAVLQPAQAALRALPDFDAARVAELRDALARGELPFDAGRLAGLIQRFHGKG